MTKAQIKQATAFLKHFGYTLPEYVDENLGIWIAPNGEELVFFQAVVREGLMGGSPKYNPFKDERRPRPKTHKAGS